KRRLARRFARLSRAARARVQASLERWIARDIFLFASRHGNNLRSNDRGRAGRCPPLGPAVATVRTGARSSGSSHAAGNGILQRRTARNDARPMNDSESLAEKFAKLGPWIYQFQIGGQTYGGGISAVGDVRVERFLRFAPKVETILELGSLEGAQSFILAQHPGVKRVVALEGREANLRKARFVQELLEIRNVDFVQANLEDADLAAFGKFDAVFCCGLLYHLPQPWTF